MGERISNDLRHSSTNQNLTGAFSQRLSAIATARGRRPKRQSRRHRIKSVQAANLFNEIRFNRNVRSPAWHQYSPRRIRITCLHRKPESVKNCEHVLCFYTCTEQLITTVRRKLNLPAYFLSRHIDTDADNIADAFCPREFLQQ